MSIPVCRLPYIPGPLVAVTKSGLFFHIVWPLSLSRTGMVDPDLGSVSASGRFWMARWIKGPRDFWCDSIAITGWMPRAARLSDVTLSWKCNILCCLSFFSRSATEVSSHEVSIARVRRLRRRNCKVAGEIRGDCEERHLVRRVKRHDCLINGDLDMQIVVVPEERSGEAVIKCSLQGSRTACSGRSWRQRLWRLVSMRQPRTTRTIAILRGI